MAIEKKTTSTVATTNHTINYDLPLWEGGDITSWIGNLNDAFNKIDSGIYRAQQTADSLREIGDNLQDLFDQTTRENTEIRNTLQQINANIDTLDIKTDAIREQLTEVNEAVVQNGIEFQAVNARLESIEDDIGKIMHVGSGVYKSFDAGSRPTISSTDGGREIEILSYSCNASGLSITVKPITETAGDANYVIPDDIFTDILRATYANSANEIRFQGPTTYYSKQIVYGGFVYSDDTSLRISIIKPVFNQANTYYAFYRYIGGEQ